MMVRKLTPMFAPAESEKATALHGIEKFCSENSSANSKTQQMVFAPIVRVSRSGASGRIGRPRVARQRSGWLSYKCHVATMIGARCHHCRRSATPKALRVGFRAIHAGPHASAR